MALSVIDLEVVRLLIVYLEEHRVAGGFQLGRGVRWGGGGNMSGRLAAEMAGRLRVAKLNVDENPATAARFDLRSIPTLLVFKGGREVDRIVGVQPKSEISRRLEPLIA